MKKNQLKNYIYGIIPTSSLIESRPELIRGAKIINNIESLPLLEIKKTLERLDINIDLVSRSELDRLSSSKNHQGVLLYTRNLNQTSITDLEELAIKKDRKFKALILDGIQDPRNLGACIRTADAAGVDAVIITKNRSADLTPSAIKSAAGATESVMVVKVTNLANTLRWLKNLGIQVIGTDMNASKTIFEHSFSAPIAVVLGSEGKGMRRLTRDLCDDLVSIPMYGKVSSLNVSVATGIILYRINQT